MDIQQQSNEALDVIIIGGSYAGLSAVVASGNMAGAMANSALAGEAF